MASQQEKRLIDEVERHVRRLAELDAEKARTHRAVAALVGQARRRGIESYKLGHAVKRVHGGSTRRGYDRLRKLAEREAARRTPRPHEGGRVRSAEAPSAADREQEDSMTQQQTQGPKIIRRRVEEEWYEPEPALDGLDEEESDAYEDDEVAEDDDATTGPGLGGWPRPRR